MRLYCSYRYNLAVFPNNFLKIVFRIASRIEVPMKARVYVSIKPTILDPQGQTIRSALVGLGHKEITSVRQAKYFEIELAAGTPPDHAAKVLDEIARDVLSNPVIEDYRVEILD
jgi:phosphoribosylformylglycinamidine synthase subunit PurS